MDHIGHEEFMRQMAKQQEDAFQKSAKEVYGDVDMVNKPPHYNQAGVECIDALRAALGEGFEYYLQGNVMKYLWRYRYKNGTQDLEKAMWYLDALTTEVEGCIMIRVKVFLTISVDPEEYPVPADGQVGAEIEEAIEEYFYDIDGANIKSIKTITE